jgi:hypothetical protein
VTADRPEIEGLLEVEKERRSEVFDALVQNRYLTIQKNGKYLVRGNKKHVDVLKSRSIAGQIGGRKSAELRRTKANDPSGDSNQTISPAKQKILVQNSRRKLLNDSILNQACASTSEPSSLLFSSSLSFTKRKEEEEKALTARAAIRETEPLNLGPLPDHQLVVIWNANRGALPVCKGLGSKDRKKNAEARWRENPNPQYWIEIVRSMAASPFLRGEKNSPEHLNWRADFDFFVRADTHLKVSEGRYGLGSPSRKVKTLAEHEAELAAFESGAVRVGVG